MNIELIRKKQDADNIKHDELIERLNKHIDWMKEYQIKPK